MSTTKRFCILFCTSDVVNFAFYNIPLHSAVTSLSDDI